MWAMKLETETKCLWTESADYNTYQKNCEFLERNHNQEEKGKKEKETQENKSQASTTDG